MCAEWVVGGALRGMGRRGGWIMLLLPASRVSSGTFRSETSLQRAMNM